MECGSSGSRSLAHLVRGRVAVWAFAIVVAVNQLALASGLAFGLGGRDRAARLLDEWAQRSERVGPRREPAVERPAPAADPGWIPRSGVDRRRVARGEPDRRVAGPVG